MNDDNLQNDCTNAKVATAADLFQCDIGITEGRITALTKSLPAGPNTREIDAEGHFVTPGAVDGHCHLDQPMPAPMKLADNFETCTRSAACGDTNTFIPFATQQKASSLRAAVDDYRCGSDGRASVDYAFHLVVSDPTPHVLQHEYGP